MTYSVIDLRRFASEALRMKFSQNVGVVFPVDFPNPVANLTRPSFECCCRWRTRGSLRSAMESPNPDSIAR